MKSIRDLYKVGKGPSSSHTMGPERAARIFKQENPGAERYEVTLYGSLALTGVGHGTDRVLSEVLAPTPTEIIFSKKDPGDLRHPNTLDFAAYKGEEKLASMRVESIGGGDIVIEGREAAEPDDVYPENSFAEIAQYCRWRYISLREYVELNEGPGDLGLFADHLAHHARRGRGRVGGDRHSAGWSERAAQGALSL